MKTHIIENTWLRKSGMTMPRLNIDCGWGNGYVLLDKGHPWFEVPYDDIPVEVHGGLTFSSLITEITNSHLGLTKKDIGKYMIGFDTAHYGDTLEEWTKERVQQEADRLLAQCKDINNLK